MARYGEVWRGEVGSGGVRYGRVSFYLQKKHLVRHGPAWLGAVG